MSVLLDILGSTFIGGMLLLLMLKLNLYATNTSYYSDSELKLQQSAKTLAEILNYDLRKVGFNHDKSTGSSFITVKDDTIEFKADILPLYGDGETETIKYYLGEPEEINGQEFRELKRRINNSPDIGGPSLGLVNLKFTYLDSLSQIIVNPNSNKDLIRYIKTEMWVEPEIQFNNFVTGVKDEIFTYWEFTINPRNL
ncbi:MAG: hypothetical protein R6W68_01025 [Ignavibacteriaceae bacterium]